MPMIPLAGLIIIDETVHLLLTPRINYIVQGYEFPSQQGTPGHTRRTGRAVISDIDAEESMHSYSSLWFEKKFFYLGF